MNKNKSDRNTGRFDRRNFFSKKFNGGINCNVKEQTLRVVELKKSLFPLFDVGDILIETFPGSGYYVNYDYYQNLTLNIRDILKIRDVRFEDYFVNLDPVNFEDAQDCPGLRQFFEVCIKPTRDELLQRRSLLREEVKDIEYSLKIFRFYEGYSF